MAKIHIILYSKTKRDQTFLSGFNESEEALLWDELARKSDVVNGWSDGAIRLRNTDKTRFNFKEIEKKYSSRTKNILRVTNFFNFTGEGDFFYIINASRATLAELVVPIEVLKSDTSNYWEWVNIHNRYFDLWSRISFEFAIETFGLMGIQQKVGEVDKSKRICRFCGADGPFKYVAHAIPEALGNTLLICNEECDVCNQRLKEIEDNFIHLMDFRRAMYKIKSKKSSDCRTIYGNNYTIAPDSYGEPILYIKSSQNLTRTTLDGYREMKFDHYEPVVDQDIYRALVKMAIDLMPSSRLVHFQKTIEWLTKRNDDIIPDALPSVGYGTLPDGNMYEQPVLFLFFRPEKVIDIPYCTAILFITDIAYKFVIPYVDADNGLFKYDEELTTLNQRLDKYLNVKWEYQQYFSWWESNIWNYWPLNDSETNIQILPENNPIFKPEKSYTTQELNAFDANIFVKDDITNVGVSILGLSKTKSKSIEILFKDSPLLILDFTNGTGRLLFKSVIDKLEKTLNFRIDCSIRRLQRINCRDKYITGATFDSLIKSIWNKSIQPLRRKLSLSLKIELSNIAISTVNQAMLESSIFEFHLPNQRIIKSSYKSLVL